MSEVDRLRQILDLVQESLDEPDLTGADLAGRAFLSRFHFDRLVRSALGEAPGAFRRRLLLERAAYLLASGDQPVVEIALAAGYGSPEAFTRAFGRAYGLSPSAYRCRGAGPHDLAGASRVHFHPPGSLRLPAETRETTMDVLLRMVEHHLLLVGQIIERLPAVNEAVLDRPIELSVEGIDSEPTLRSITERLVSQLEMWVRAVQGRSTVPATGDATAAGLAARLSAVIPDFSRLVVDPVTEGRAEDTFVDTTCEPVQTFTYGGVLAHVLTFSAVRRTLAIGALESAGVDDLGAGDPMSFVGGTGEDASRLTRT